MRICNINENWRSLKISQDKIEQKHKIVRRVQHLSRTGPESGLARSKYWQFCLKMLGTRGLRDKTWAHHKLEGSEVQNYSNGSRFNGERVNGAKKVRSYTVHLFNNYRRTRLGTQKIRKSLYTVRYQQSWRKLIYSVCYKYQIDLVWKESPQLSCL